MRTWMVLVLVAACGGGGDEAVLDLPEEYVEGDGDWEGSLSGSVTCDGPTNVVSVSGPPGSADVSFRGGDVVAADVDAGGASATVLNGEMWSSTGMREGWFQVAETDTGAILGYIDFLLHCPTAE